MCTHVQKTSKREKRKKRCNPQVSRSRWLLTGVMLPPAHVAEAHSVCPTFQEVGLFLVVPFSLWFVLLSALQRYSLQVVCIVFCTCVLRWIVSPLYESLISLIDIRYKIFLDVFSQKKELSPRLQELIKTIVDEDHSSFVKTRCIADNFVYTIDFAQVYGDRKKEVMVVKLDFS